MGTRIHRLKTLNKGKKLQNCKAVIHSISIIIPWQEVNHLHTNTFSVKFSSFLYCSNVCLILQRDFVFTIILYKLWAIFFQKLKEM